MKKEIPNTVVWAVVGAVALLVAFLLYTTIFRATALEGDPTKISIPSPPAPPVIS